MSRDAADVPAARSLAAAAATLAVLVATCALVAWRSQPPSVRSSDAPASEFSAERALAKLRTILGDASPHPGGTAAHARVREQVVGELAALGYQPAVQETLARGPSDRVAVVRNVLARTRPGSDGVLLCAHYDSVGSGPGAGDDGAGVATLLEVARALSESPELARPVLFLISDAEEAGLIGASAFAEQHPWAADVGMVINVEGRGTSGPSMLFETSGPNAALIDAFARSADRPWTTSVAELVYKNMPNDTDLSVFRARGVPGFNFAFIGGLWNYHTPHDDLAHLDPRSLQHHGDNALALLRTLANSPAASKTGGAAVFFDVASLAVVRWPTSWSVPLGLLAAVIAGAILASALRSGATSWRRLGVASAACCASAAATVALAAGIGWVLQRVHGAQDIAVAQPWTMRCTLLALAVLGPALVGSRRVVAAAGAASIAFAATAMLALLALATSLWLTEASYLFVVPALASIPCVGLARSRSSDALAPWFALPVLAALAVLWCPIALSMELGFHYMMPALIAAPMSVVAAATLPTIARLERRTGRVLLWSALAATVASCAAAALVPAHSRERPGWLNLRYVENCGTHDARWEASTFGADLPAGLAREHFERTATPPFPWLTLDRSLYQCAAPQWDAPAPELASRAREQLPDGRRWTCHLRSARGVPRLHLHVPERASIESIEWRGQRLDRDLERIRTLLLFAVDDDGIDVTLRARGDGPLEVWLLDQGWTMPPDFERIRAARPQDMVPRSDGDVSILGQRFVLD